MADAFVIKEIKGFDNKRLYYIEAAGHRITNNVTNLKDAEQMLEKQKEHNDGRFRNSWHLL